MKNFLPNYRHRKEKLPFKRQKPLAEPNSGRVAICLTRWGLRGQERGDNKHHKSKPGIPAEEEKQ